jgi:hypothetical protein
MLPREPAPAEAMNAQVIRLLSGVSAHGDQHLAEVERDLVQMDALLDEAIKKLCASFMAIHQAISAQQETLDALVSGRDGDEPAERLQALREEIAGRIGEAVTGLQFQDMTSQLIARMAQHLAGLRDVFSALGTEGAPVPAESDSPAARDVLERIHACVDARCAESGGTVRSTVNQRHMESGDIELF